tara:strand:+ start:479 stop:721 length:243 start_codon:yes stop_codon:yes gene_type:complete
MQYIDLQVKIREAKPMDLMELDFVRVTGQKVWKLKEGIPFFLKNTDGKISPNPYITTDATDQKDLGIYFKQKRVFILKQF